MSKEKIQSLIAKLENKKWQDGKASELLTSIQEKQTEALRPVLESMAKSLTESMTRDFAQAVKEIKVEVPEITAPQVNMPKMDPIQMPEFPKIPAPIVNYTPPKIVMPEMKMPTEMDIKGWVRLMGVDLDHPLPVQIRDASGKPVDLTAGFKQVLSGGNSGKADFFTIKGFGQSAYSEFTNADGRLRVSVETGGSGLTDSEIRATALPVSQVSGANWSVSVAGSTGTIGVVTIDPDGNPTYASSTSGLTDAELRASSLDVKQTSGTIDSVYVTGVAASFFSEITNPDGRVKVELPTGSSGLTDTELRASHLDVQQVSGAIDSVYVTGIATSVGAYLLDAEGNYRSTLPVSGTVTVSDVTASVKSALIDSSGVQYSGSNPVPIGGTVAVSDITASVKSALIDSTGVQYSGSNPVPVNLSTALDHTIDSISVKQVSGFTDSVFVTGYADSSVVYEVMTTNKTAKADGADIRPKTDDLGRTLTRPVQVRDLTSTAYVSVSTGTETALFAGATSTFHDLIYILASNNSTAAVGVDVRATTGGNVIMHLEVPANGVVGVSTPVPIPAGDVGASWTVDLPDITGTTVYVSALFSKEI
jgi:hypothetical protein